MTGSRPLSANEITKLREKLSVRDRLFVIFGAHFGLRLSESLALRFGDLENQSHLFIRSLKNSNPARFPIPDSVKEAVSDLRREMEESGLEAGSETAIFYSQKSGAALTKYSAAKIISTAVKALGFEGRVTSHSMRKSFVTEVYRKTGKDVIATRKFSRHKSLTNLIFYVDDSSVDLDLIKDLKW